MTPCLPLWRELLSGDIDEHFIIHGLLYGFDIVNLTNVCEVKPVQCANYKSATNAHVKLQVEQQILHEVSRGQYMVTSSKPRIISALGAIPKQGSDELRLIHDCSRPHGKGVNAYALPDSFQFNTVDNACELLQKVITWQK